jgi:signal transduction histidine kinase
MTRPMLPLRRRWQQLRRSLGLRLMLLFVLLALTLAAVFLIGMQRVFSVGYGELVKPMVVDYVDRLAAEIGSPPSVARAQALEQRLPIAVYIQGPVVNYGVVPKYFNHDRHHDPHRNEQRYDSGEWTLSRSTADGHRVHFGIQPSSWPRQPRTIGWFTLAALLALTAVAYLWVRRLFRPIADIRAGALRFGQGEFAQPIPIRHHDELGELAEQVNRMAASLQGMLDAKRALLLAISHELRSPLTRARLNAELVPDSTERSALLQDLAEMRELISSLLEQERLAAGHSALHAVPTDVNALVRAVVAETFADAAITLELDASLPAVTLDPTRVRLALRNLVANALQHGVSSSACQLHTAREGDALVISVRDFGVGVSAEQLQHLAEPFYRPDAARGRDSGGVGLGLTLAKGVAQAHGGELQLRLVNPGLRASLVLPIQAPMR